MDLYGDKGNIKTLKYRCENRDIDFIYDTCSIGEVKDFSSYDLIFMGGGADKEQKILAKDLLEKKEGLKKALDEGSFFLLICGGYQLFGEYYIDADGERIEGLGFFPYRTEKSEQNTRCIGNIYMNVDLDGEKFDVLGFENHGGQTYGNDESFFGELVFGKGNYYGSKYEGFYNGSVIGTYVHGPLLPKNPKLADFIIKKALFKRNGRVDLLDLDDAMEVSAKKELLANIT